MRHLVSIVRQQALGFVALCVALSGTAYAAAALQANSVTSSTVKNSSLTSADIKNGTLLKQDFKAGQLPTGGQAAAGAAGPKGDPGTNGTNGINGTNGLNGAAGAVGVTGPVGATGPTGPTGVAGSARAYARIDGAATPSIRSTPSAVNISSVTKVAVAPTAPQTYCVVASNGLTPANAVMLATPDIDDTALNGAGETVQVDGGGDPSCPAGAFVVRTFDKNGDNSPASFVVMVP